MKIVVNFASAADFIADNSTPEGRLENQRVEVELAKSRSETAARLADAERRAQVHTDAADTEDEEGATCWLQIVLADAVASRSEGNWKNGLELCARTGATIANTETVVFDLLGKAGTDDFKALSRLIR